MIKDGTKADRDSPDRSMFVSGLHQTAHAGPIDLVEDCGLANAQTAGPGESWVTSPNSGLPTGEPFLVSVLDKH